jgi:AmmeMemoRadiSam system protein A
MAPSPSPEVFLTDADAAVLLDIAEATLVSALRGELPTLPPLHALPLALRARVGLFVSLHVGGDLNGCIGTVEGVEPLGHAVARLALSAAFADPRLHPLRRRDFADLTVEVSLLSPLAPIVAETRAELVAALRPGVDGVVITAADRQALFLPVVWKQLPEPDDFLDHLWHKAGLVPRVWPSDTQAFRFTAQRHERRAGEGRRPSAA